MDATTIAKGHKQLTKHQQLNLNVKQYHSGEGYKNISKELDMPRNSEDCHQHVEKERHNLYAYQQQVILSGLL